MTGSRFLEPLYSKTLKFTLILSFYAWSSNDELFEIISSGTEMLCLDRKSYCGKTPPHHLPFIAVVKVDNVRWVFAFWVMQSLFKFEKKRWKQRYYTFWEPWDANMSGLTPRNEDSPQLLQPLPCGKNVCCIGLFHWSSVPDLTRYLTGKFYDNVSAKKKEARNLHHTS